MLEDSSSTPPCATLHTQPLSPSTSTTTPPASTTSPPPAVLRHCSESAAGWLAVRRGAAVRQSSDGGIGSWVALTTWPCGMDDALTTTKVWLTL